jgi:hypothetical protein
LRFNKFKKFIKIFIKKLAIIKSVCIFVTQSNGNGTKFQNNTLKIKIMTTATIKIGQEVVTIKGDMTGRIGIITNIEGDRATVKWGKGYGTTKNKLNTMALTTIPYEIIPFSICKKTGKFTNPKYITK